MSRQDWLRGWIMLWPYTLLEQHVCLFVIKIILKVLEIMKFSGNADNDTKNKLLHFGDVLDSNVIGKD